MNRPPHTPHTHKGHGAALAVANVLSRRDGIIIVLFVLLGVWLVSRLFTLGVVQAHELAEQGSAERTALYQLTARRGNIYDVNGNILATSVDATTIYANPNKTIEVGGERVPVKVDLHETARILHQVLGTSSWGKTQQEYYELLTASPNATFVYVAKKADPALAQALREVNVEYYNAEVAKILARGDDIPAEIITPLSVIEYQDTTRREYPKGDLGAQVIGRVEEYTEFDEEGNELFTIDRGVSGLEQTYDSILRGINGRRVVEVGKPSSQGGDPLPMIGSIIEEVAPVAGQDIIISLDIEMQQFLEMNLQAVAIQRKTTNASAILLDGSTGEIVAVASLPLYSRDKVTEEDIANGATNAKAITMPYEPGSTFKSVIAAAALEQGIMKAEDSIFCPAVLEIYDKVVKDSINRSDTEMTLRQIIANSSNVGVSLIEQKIGDELFYNYLVKCGLGSFTHVDYPGETSGNLAELQDWNPVQAANISFGQGIEVSLLQMASIYGAVANDGVLVQPHFLVSRPQVAGEVSYPSRRVFQAQTTRDLEELLRSCVTEGYGVNAAIDGYDVVGKTGTAEKADVNGGYETYKGQYICSFVGYLDNSSSNYVFMSSFDNPTNYADSPATTFFSSVMSFVANRYLIVPQAEVPLTGDMLLGGGQAGEAALLGEGAPAAGSSAGGSSMGGASGSAGVDNDGSAGAGVNTGNANGSTSGAKEGSSGQSVKTGRGSGLSVAIPRARNWVLDTSG